MHKFGEYAGVCVLQKWKTKRYPAETSGRINLSCCRKVLSRKRESPDCPPWIRFIINPCFNIAMNGQCCTAASFLQCWRYRRQAPTYSSTASNNTPHTLRTTLVRRESLYVAAASVTTGHYNLQSQRTKCAAIRVHRPMSQLTTLQWLGQLNEAQGKHPLTTRTEA